MDKPVEQADALIELINMKKWPELQEAWTGVVQTAPQPVDFHLHIVSRLIRKKHLSELESLYGALLQELLTKKAEDAALELVRMILRLKPDAAFLLDPLRTILKRQHSERPAERVEEFLRLAGLVAGGGNIAQALAKFENLAGVARGRVFRHTRWGLGIVTHLDPQAQKVTVDFPLKKGQVFTIDGVREFLQAIPPDHFVAAMVRDPQGTKQRLETSPAETVQFILRSYGGMVKAADLKKILLEGLFDEPKWKSWWTKSRDVLKVDPWIDLVGAGANMELRLRHEMRSFGDEVLTRLNAAAGIPEIREVFRDLRRHLDDSPISAPQAESLSSALHTRLRGIPASEPVARLPFGYLWEEFNEILPGHLHADEWNEAGLLALDGPPAETANRIVALDVFEYQTRACEGVRRYAADKAPAVYVQVLPRVGPRLASWLERQLAALKADVQRHAALDEVIGHPERNPDLFLWAFRNILDGVWTDVAEGVPHSTLFLDFLMVLNDHHRLMEQGGPEAAESKAVVSRYRSFLNDTNHIYLKKVAKAGTLEEAKKMLAAIHLHNAIPDSWKEGCEAILIGAHPDLRRQTRSQAQEEQRKPPTHYATQESVDRIRQRLSHIKNVEMAETAKAIGIARDHGDLRENADYHAAKDKQKLLAKTAQELEDLLSRARVVDPGNIRTDCVVFGTRFKARETATGQVRSYTILGMWEANPDQNIISYLTPLGQAFMNARPGQTVELTSRDGKPTTYEVLEIEKAI